MGSVVVPSESASNTGSVTGSDECGAVRTEIVSTLVHAFEIMDRRTYDALFKFAVDQQAIDNRWVSLQAASNRRACAVRGGASNSDLSSGTSSTSRVGGTNPRLDSIKRAASWRIKSIPAGYCYTKLFRESVAERQAQRLGPWPTVASLLQTSSAHFRSLSDLSGLSMSGDVSAAHVSDVVESGVEATPVLESMKRVAMGLKTSKGSFGELLRGSSVPLASSGVVVKARTAVGGSSRVVGVGEQVPLELATVYLAGTAETSMGFGWREWLIRSSEFTDYAAVYSRNPDMTHIALDIRTVAVWERTAMESVDCVLFNFSAGSPAEEALLQLGQVVRTSNVVVVCQNGYHKADVVREVCQHYGVPVFLSLKDSMRTVRAVATDHFALRQLTLIEGTQSAGAIDVNESVVRSVHKRLSEVALEGIPDEAAMQRYASFLRDCPRYLASEPRLRFNPVVANSEVILQTVNAVGEMKTYQCDVSRLQPDARSRVEVVMDGIFEGFTKVPFLGGFAYVTSDRTKEYFGPERVAAVNAVNALAAVVVSYARCLTHYEFR